jgi:hypothetical protein
LEAKLHKALVHFTDLGGKIEQSKTFARTAGPFEFAGGANHFRNLRDAVDGLETLDEYLKLLAQHDRKSSGPRRQIEKRLADLDEVVASYQQWKQKVFDSLPDTSQDLFEAFDEASQQVLNQQMAVKDCMGKAQSYDNIEQSVKDYKQMISVLEEKQKKVLKVIDRDWYEQIEREMAKATQYKEDIKTRENLITQTGNKSLEAKLHKALVHFTDLGGKIEQSKTFARTAEPFDFTERANRMRNLTDLVNELETLDKNLGELWARHNAKTKSTT